MLAHPGLLLVGLLLAADGEPRRDLHGDPLPAGARGRLGGVRLFHPETVSGVRFSPDGTKIVSAGGGPGAVRVWDAADGKPLLAAAEQERSASLAAFSPDGKRLAPAAGTRFPPRAPLAQ